MAETEERTGSHVGDYVQYVVEQLVDDADRVSINESTEGDELFVDIDVAPEDRGRVIGKNGRLIRSLRVVVRAAAGRDGSRASVELVEEDEDGPSPDDATAAG